MKVAELLANQLDGSRLWTLKLLEDVSGDEWTFQPFAGSQHILWTCGHLAVAEHLLVLTRCLGGPAPDPAFAIHFPIGGPVQSADKYSFPSPEAIREAMRETHQKVVSAIPKMNELELEKPCFGADGKPHPHYRTNAEAIAHCSRHEGFHAGQIALLRRLLGKPFLR